jgi:signal transduction histidine kinase
MDFVRGHLADAVKRKRPELTPAELGKLVEKVVQLIQTYPPQSESDSSRVPAAGESSDFSSERHSVPEAQEAIAFVVICEPDGTLAEVVRDAVGLGARFAPGAEFTAIVSPFHHRRSARFLRTVRDHHAAYDSPLGIVARTGMIRLFCSGFAVGAHLVLFATREPLAVSSRGDAIATATGPSPEIAPAHPAGPTRSNLLRLAAHDLRNPVSGILAACEYLLEDATRVMEPHHVLVLNSIESSSRAALQLIDSLSEIPAIALSAPQLELRAADLTSITQEAVSDVRPHADLKKVKVNVRVKERMPALQCDPARLRDAFQGILVNAIGKSQEEGKVEVAVSAGAGEARISVRGENLAQAPEPPASKPAKLPRRISARKLTDIHAALLLARARLIIRAHGGSLRQENHGANGQSWTVTLPMAAHEPARKA